MLFELYIFHCIFAMYFKLTFPCASVYNCKHLKSVVFVIGLLFPLCIILIFVYLKYSENYETDALFRILCGCHQNIFYTSTEINLLPVLLALLHLLNAAGKLLTSQPLMLKPIRLGFSKIGTHLSKIK